MQSRARLIRTVTAVTFLGRKERHTGAKRQKYTDTGGISGESKSKRQKYTDTGGICGESKS